MAKTADRKEILLELQGVCKYFPVKKGFFQRTVGSVKAVDDITLTVEKGTTLGIVGESGCGKTTLGRTIIRLNKPTKGTIKLRMNGKMVDLATRPKRDLEVIKKMQIVFQDPYASLNPSKNIFSAFDEPLKIQGIKSREERLAIATKMMETVNLQPEYLFRYPHEFSGGQRQRICIAKALALDPELIVCDEAVSALDVSIQASIMNLLRRLQKERDLTYLFISHNLSVVQYMSDKIAVMYLGKLVELADSEKLYNHCLHPYTEALLSAVPVPKVGVETNKIQLTGDIPSPINPPSGCRFHPRCRYCTEKCKTEEPQLVSVTDDGTHMVACHHKLA